jgi:hypothetical protein
MPSMEPAPSKSTGSILQTTLLLLANLTVMIVVSISIGTHYDTDENVNSATPFSDGAIYTMIVVILLVLLNGTVLCLSPATRRIGVGAVIAAVVAVPIGIAVLLLSLASVLGDA